MIKVPVEKREKKKKRVPLTVPCKYCADPKVCTDASTFDYSEGGMCFYSNKQVEIGRSLDIECRDLWEAPKVGIVRWVQRVQHRLYRVGVSFEDK